MSDVEVLRSGLLAMPHGFLGRQGGVSQGEMWGLNVGYGSGDDPDLIAENRRRAVEVVLPGARLATVHRYVRGPCGECHRAVRKSRV